MNRARHYFSKMVFLMECHFLNLHPWTCMKTVHIPFKSSFLQSISVLQIIGEGHMSLAYAIFMTTALFWWWSLELLMLTINHKIYHSHTYLRKRFFVFTSFWVYVFEINNLKVMLDFYLYHEGYYKRGPNEICSLLLDYMKLKLSRNCIFFLTQNRNHNVVMAPCNVSC
jgi:hypothetical protein